MLTDIDCLKAILESKFPKSDFEIRSHNLKPTPKSNVFMCDHALLTLKVFDPHLTANMKLTFFVKLFPQLESVASFCQGTGAFKKEIFMYELFEKFDPNLIYTAVPKCHFSHMERFIVLDNLEDDYYTVLEKRETLSYDKVLVILQALARFHASSIIYEEKQSTVLNKAFRLGEEYSQELEESFFNEKEDFINRKGIEASIKGVLKEIEIFDKDCKLASGRYFKIEAKKLLCQVYKLVKPSNKYRNVICHGDLWAANFMVRYDKGKPIGSKLVDFQCGRYAPPSHDLLGFLYLTTSREFRKKHLFEVIGIYYSYLEKTLKNHEINIKDIIKFEDFIDSCKEQKLFGIIQAAFYFPLILLRAEDVEEYFSNEELNHKALFEDRSHMIMENLNKDENYKLRLKETIDDLMDYCEYL